MTELLTNNHIQQSHKANNKRENMSVKTVLIKIVRGIWNPRSRDEKNLGENKTEMHICILNFMEIPRTTLE